MRILDLFCGAGLVADGLMACGWEVVGVDIIPQPAYPAPFVLADALTLDGRWFDWADAIWASPPCLRETAMRYAPGAKGEAHPDLIAPTRELLRRIGKPYVIENVATAPLENPVILCGSMFGLGVSDGGVFWQLHRHRKFETNWPLKAPSPCRHTGPVVGVYGGHARKRSAAAGGRGTRDVWERSHPAIMSDAMGLVFPEGLTAAEISQGIPPAYAAYVGRRLQRWIASRHGDEGG